MSRFKRTTYAIAIDDQVGDYGKPIATSAEACRLAYRAVRHDGAQSVTVLRLEFPGGQEFASKVTPLVTVTPPVTPTTSTSPGGSA